MRIRKTLAKSLGYASPPFPPPSETPTSLSSPNTSVSGSSGLICQLNQSPWDVYPNYRFVRSSFKCFDGVRSPQLPKEEHEDKSGEISEHEKVDVLGKIIPTMEMAEEKPLVSKRVNAVSKKEKKKEVKKEFSNEITPCKKNDGRNWFCKRPAKLPYNLCEHHLAQSRSYKEISSGSVGCKTKKQKETGEFYSEYYYYGTVTPSRGKRRSTRNVDDGSTSTAMDVKEQKMGKNDVLDGHNKDCVELQGHTAFSGSNNSEEEVKLDAKRARKLVKYRSMDSLPEVEP